MRTGRTSRWRPFLFQYSAIDAVFISPYEHFSIIDRPRKSNFFFTDSNFMQNSIYTLKFIGIQDKSLANLCLVFV